MMATDVRVRLSDHARERAAEMGIPTKLVKRALREPEMTYRSYVVEGAVCAKLDNLLVPYIEVDGVREAITVLWWAPTKPFSRIHSDVLPSDSKEVT